MHIFWVVTFRVLTGLKYVGLEWFNKIGVCWSHID